VAAPNAEVETDVNTDETDTNEKPEGGNKPAEPFSREQQEFINKLLADNKRQTRKELDAERKRAADLEKRLKDFEDKSVKEDVRAASADDKTAEGKVDALLKRHERQLAEMNQKLAEAEARAQTEAKKLSEAQRDRLLDEALVAAGCVDMKVGRRTFLPDLTKFDEDGVELDTWVLKTENGKLVDINTGISETLPKYLRNPASNAGGSGVTSGGVKASDRNKVQQLKTEVTKLEQVAKANPTASNVAAYTMKLKELKALEASLNTKGRSP
jgi:uncharacterized phage infection (PIP) family protein YhgE